MHVHTVLSKNLYGYFHSIELHDADADIDETGMRKQGIYSHA